MLATAALLAIVTAAAPEASTSAAAAPAEPSRVSAARAAAGPRLRELFQQAGVAYPPGEIFLRAFKLEGEVELWAGKKGAPLALVKRYRLCALSGTAGPKRRMGDLQVPEGVYRINRFNPWSNFHLSLGLDYPNAADRIAGQRAGERNLGGDIFIHGSCVTIGCMPLGDEAIEELYVTALDARAGGQGSILVHVFPHRLDEDGLRELGAQSPEWLPFWKTLQPIYQAFEQTRCPPQVSVDPRTGSYKVEPAARGRCPYPGTAR